MLTIDVAFDLICPWCWIGKRHLAQALAQWAELEPQVPVQVLWHGVQLLPQLPAAGVSYTAFYLNRLGSAEAIQARQAQVQAAAHQAGLDIRFDAMRVMPNTARAHRLLALAQRTGTAQQQDALIESLFRAHFVQGRDLGHVPTLVALAQACGLDNDLAAQAIDHPQATKASPLVAPAGGVPHFVVNHRWSLVGAQPPHVLLSAMRQALPSVQPV